MRSVRKVLGVILALTLLIGTMAGCSHNNNKQVDSPQGQADHPPVNPAGEMPVMKERTTFHVMTATANYIKDLATNDFTKYYEDLTNIHLEFEIVPTASRSEKVSVALSGGDYPNFFLGMALSKPTIYSYANQGIIVSISKYIDKYAPNLQKVFTKESEVKNILTYPDGNIYTFSQMENASYSLYPAKMWVYRPWLEKLDLNEPQTTEEFYQMLKAFKEQDPNGNGKTDEIPLAGSTGDAIDRYLMTPFIYNDGAKRFVVKDNKLDVAYTQPEWKEGLKYMNKLYKEGLIAPESFTQNRDQRIQMTSSGDDVTVGATPASTNNSFINYGMPDKRDANYYTVPPLKGPSGNAYTVYTPENMVNNNGQLVITDKCKYPEAIVRWADGFLTEEMTMRSVYGVEGVNWRKANPDEKGALGEPGKYVLIDNWTDVQNFAWKRQGPDYRPLDLIVGEVYTDNFDNNPFLEGKRNYIGHEPPADQLVGTLILDNEQTEEVADIDKSINSYVNESIARFVTGDRNIDKEWDTYLSELNKMDLDKYLKIYGTAFEAKRKNASK